MAAASTDTRGSTGAASSAATSFLRSSIGARSRRSGGDTDERERLSQFQEDRPADFRPERLAVEDHLGAFTLNADLVAFLEMDSAHARMAELAGDRREQCAQQRCRPLLDRDQPQGAAFEALELAR